MYQILSCTMKFNKSKSSLSHTFCEGKKDHKQYSENSPIIFLSHPKKVFNQLVIEGKLVNTNVALVNFQELVLTVDVIEQCRPAPERGITD